MSQQCSIIDGISKANLFLMKIITPLYGQYRICCHTHVLTRILNRKKVTLMLPLGLATDFVEIVEIISKFKNMMFMTAIYALKMCL